MITDLERYAGSQKPAQELPRVSGSGQRLAEGWLGPNGAGKTTTVSIIAGLIHPNRGEVLIEGRRLAGDTDPVKRRIGLVPQDLALYDELPARDNLALFGALYGLDRSTLKRAMAEVLELVGLAD